MKSPTNTATIATDLLQPKGLAISSCTSIQTLWAGYGHICQVEATPIANGSHEACSTQDRPQSLILKYIQPPTKNLKSTSPDEGHLRKVLSYQVEQYFYTYLAPQLPQEVAVARCIASINSISGGTNTTAMVMSDLRKDFPVAGEKRGKLDTTQTQAALTWLADFHGFWWSQIQSFEKDKLVLPPLQHYEQHQSTALQEQTVWRQGGYTYLDTRRTEYTNLKQDSDLEWSSKLCSPTSSGPSIAELAARFLATSRESLPYQTLIHGDVKSENLFTTKTGDRVAFYDFQYVGLGLGVSDLAKLFTCSISLSSLVDDVGLVYGETKISMQKGEKRLLEAYLRRLERRSGKEYEWNMFVRHWQVALVDWLRFQASWGFWGNSEWLEARVRSILEDKD